jgi:hypothetical protein
LGRVASLAQQRAGLAVKALYKTFLELRPPTNIACLSTFSPPSLAVIFTFHQTWKKEAQRRIANSSDYGACGKQRARCSLTGYDVCHHLFSVQLLIFQQGYEILQDEMNVSLDEFAALYADQDGNVEYD